MRSFIRTIAATTIFIYSIADAQVVTGAKRTASGAGLCEDLYQYACAPGTYNDGTGNASNDEVLDLEKVKRAVDKSKQKTTQKFLELLRKPKGEDLLKATLSMTGTTYSPSCQSKMPEPQAKCHKNLAETLTALTAATLMKSFEGIAGDNLKGLDLDINEFKYVITDAEYRKIAKDFAESAFESIDLKSQEQKAKKVFDRIVPIIEGKLKSTIRDPEQLRIMLARLTRIEFAGTSCMQDLFGREPDGPAEMVPQTFENNAFFNPTGKGRIEICRGRFFANQSEYSMVYALAHELGHPNDPCGIAFGPKDFTFQYTPGAGQEKAESEFPFTGVIQCLRRPESIQALRKTEARTVHPNSPSPAPYPAQERPTRSPHLDLDVGRDRSNFTFCKDDQIGESFSDWLSAEILPIYVETHLKSATPEQRIEGYGNIIRGMCRLGSSEGSELFTTHPDWRRRVNRILLQQPKVRQQLGCKEPHSRFVYCAVESESGGMISHVTAAPEPADKPKMRVPLPKSIEPAEKSVK
jgi:hypothetical protein